MVFRNAEHFKQVYSRLQTRVSDPSILTFSYKKAYQSWFNDPPQYNYYWVSCVVTGTAAALMMRHLLFNPDVHFRRGDVHRNIADRWRHHMYSLPYFNHFLRNFTLSFSNSLIDNEPDFMGKHPWGVRPERRMHYGRFPFFFSVKHRYFVDDEHYEKNLHHNIEQKYNDMGYYANRLTEEE